MNPIFLWIIAHSAAKARLRKCPSCGDTQLVAENQLRDTVACRRCRTPLPPVQRFA